MTIYSKQALQFGLAVEAVRGTPETTPAKWYPVRGNPEVKFAPAHLEDEGLRGVRANYAPVAGRKLGSMKIPLVLDAQSIGEFLYSLMGAVTSTEQAVVTIDGTNNKFDFNIGAAQLTATVASGTYIIGTSQATALSLCKAVYDAIVSAEAVGTYTVTYSRSTKKFTITRSAGTFVIMWNSGTNTATSIASALGFSTAANSTGALTYTGASSVEYCFSHAFTLGTGVQPPAYTFFINWGLDVKVYTTCVVKDISFSGPVDNLINVDVEVLFVNETGSGTIGTPSFPTQKYLSFQHVTYNIAGAEDNDVRAWTLKLSNQAKHRLTLTQLQTAQDVIAPDPFMVEGTVQIDFAAQTERNKMLANTGVAHRMLIEGDTITGSYKYTVDLPITEAHYSEFPFGYENNILAASVALKAYHNGTSLILPVVKNQVVSY
jgi:hypothetical protein